MELNEKKSRIYDFCENDCQQTDWPSYRDARTLENLELYIYDYKLITYFTWIALLQHDTKSGFLKKKRPEEKPIEVQFGRAERPTSLPIAEKHKHV